MPRTVSVYDSRELETVIADHELEVGDIVEYTPENQVGEQKYKVVVGNNGGKKLKLIWDYERGHHIPNNEHNMNTGHTMSFPPPIVSDDDYDDNDEYDEKSMDYDEYKENASNGGRRKSKKSRKSKGGKKSRKAKGGKKSRKSKGGKKSRKAKRSRRHARHTRRATR